MDGHRSSSPLLRGGRPFCQADLVRGLRAKWGAPEGTGRSSGSGQQRPLFREAAPDSRVDAN